MATTVLDGEIDHFLSAALAQRIRGANAIRTKWLFLDRRHQSHVPLSGPPRSSQRSARWGAVVMSPPRSPAVGRTRTALDAADFGTEAEDLRSPRA